MKQKAALAAAKRGGGGSLLQFVVDPVGTCKEKTGDAKKLICGAEAEDEDLAKMEAEIAAEHAARANAGRKL